MIGNIFTRGSTLIDKETNNSEEVKRAADPHLSEAILKRNAIIKKSLIAKNSTTS